MPAATAQIFLHLFLLPRLLASFNAWRVAAVAADALAQRRWLTAEVAASALRR